jgi:hypothetical protein
MNAPQNKQHAPEMEDFNFVFIGLPGLISASTDFSKPYAIIAALQFKVIYNFIEGNFSGLTA